MEPDIDICDFAFFKQLTQLAFIDQIILYGSRARHDNRERSDIDLAIECPKADTKSWLQALQIIEDAETLLKIDCVRLDELSNSSPLRQEIVHEGKVLFDRTKQ